MDYYNIVVFLHALGGAMLVMTLVLMQLVFAPALGKVASADDKAAAQGVIMRRWHPVVDGVIITQSVTALIIMTSRWDMIKANHLLHVKLLAGGVALTIASLLHFYWRGKKRALKAQGKMEELQSLNRLTMAMEKVALVSAAAAFLLALAFNHLL